GTLAALRAAVTPATETQAFPLTEEPLAGLNNPQKIGARRAAGLTALHTKVPHTPERRSIGSSLRAMHIAEHGFAPGALTDKGNLKPSTTRLQIDTLPLVDVETAATILNG